MRFRLDIAYDGRPFDGWQSQPGGNTVQDYLLGSLRKICPAINSIQGSGRTDAGVSADGQVAHFDAPPDWKMDGIAWQKALNSNLPPSIRIYRCSETDSDFHARFHATGKVYRYRIFIGEILPPLEHGLVWHRKNLKPEPFIDAMQLFVGKHHFRAFSANRNDGKDRDRNTERTIFEITSVFESPRVLSIEISGNGFLYKMVRFLIGTGDCIASGKMEKEQIIQWLANPPDDKKAPYCAPPHGLSLKQVCYE